MNKKILVGTIAGAALFFSACSSTCGVDGGAVTPGSAQDFEANVPNTVYFDFDRSDISAAAKKRLEAQATWLKTYSSTKATVEGHCDIRGTSEYNMALGEARANSVAKALEKNGIAQDRLTSVSYGKERPIDNGTSEMAHAKNRRVKTTVEAG